jgi:SAM-dependent methyltransferase
MLPELDSPRILDIGCGPGGPTLELARLSGGHVTGLDINQAALDELVARAAGEGLSNRVDIVHGSMGDITFDDGSFDLVWCEAAMLAIGFARALREWHRLIRPYGFLVVHDMAWLKPDPPAEILNTPQVAHPEMRTVSEYIALVARNGYEFLGHVIVPADFWWDDHFVPLLARIGELRRDHAADRAVQTILDREQRAADLFQAFSEWYGSVFLLMQRGDS